MHPAKTVGTPQVANPTSVTITRREAAWANAPGVEALFGDRQQLKDILGDPKTDPALGSLVGQEPVNAPAHIDAWDIHAGH